MRGSRRAADGRLRHLAGRHGARAAALGRRLLLLLLAEVPGRASRHLAGVAVAAGAGADPHADARRRTLLVRLRAAGEVLDRAAGGLPPHDAQHPVLRASTRASGWRWRRASRHRWARHAEAGAPLPAADARARLRDAGRAGACSWPSCPRCGCPRAWTARRSRRRLLREHGIEVGGGLGPDAPPIWRVGLMGVNANVETADRLLEAFDAVLAPPPRERSPRAAPADGGAATARTAASWRCRAATSRALAKAPTLGADVVFLDLEDAVAPRRQGAGPRERDRRPERGRLVGVRGLRAHQRAGHALVLPRHRRGASSAPAHTWTRS